MPKPGDTRELAFSVSPAGARKIEEAAPFWQAAQQEYEAQIGSARASRLLRDFRADFAGARIMLLRRREDFLGNGWPAEMQAEASRLGRQVVFLYFAAAAAFSAYEFQLDHSWNGGPIGGIIGGIIDGGIAYFVLGAIIPMVGWAFGRFNARYAGAVFVFWFVFGAVKAFVSDYGKRYELNTKLEDLTRNSTLTGKDRVDFVRSMKLTCVRDQTANPLTPQLGISAAKISAYCDCMSEGMATAISMDEIKYFISNNGKAPASFVEKATAISQPCSKEALFQKQGAVAPPLATLPRGFTGETPPEWASPTR